MRSILLSWSSGAVGDRLHLELIECAGDGENFQAIVGAVGFLRQGFIYCVDFG